MVSFLINSFHDIFYSAARSSTPGKLKNYHNPVHMFQNPPDPEAVIIFFHDIHWGREDDQPHKSSWMSSSGECWPETWLSCEYSKTQIVSTWYDSGIWKGQTTGYMDLYRLAENLRQDILPNYGAKNCPIVLVGHGLGGLVIMALIKEMQRKRETLAWRKESQNDTNLRKLDCFLRNVQGILYYNTPFLGSRLADVLTRYLPCIGFLLGLLLSPLNSLSTEACRLNYWFSKWQAARECKTKMIWAGCPTRVGLWYGHLVEEASARVHVDDFYTVSESDHFHICVPRDRTDPRYTGLIQLICGVMPEKTPGRVALTKDNTESACAESVENILGQLQKLKQGQGLKLKRHDVTKIMQFEDLCGSVSDGLEDARLEKISADDRFEYYEPLRY